MEIETLTDKKICILGLGKSGLACIKKLSGLGASIMVSESKSSDKIPQGTAEFLKTLEIPLETGGHTEKFLCESDLIVASPGVHLDLESIEKAREKGIQIISEVELAFSFFTKPVIAVTGTNGKTTTTTLIGGILKNEGYKIAVAGNIGVPLISIDDTDLDYIVVEMSSYQLDGIDKFRPRVSLILNLTQDHLERYGGMEKYGQAKARIFMNQTKQDYLVYNGQDRLVMDLVKNAVCQKVSFAFDSASEKGAFLNGGYICRLDENYVEAICAVTDIKIKGDHNIENCLAAASACLCLKVSKAAIAKTFKEFTGVEHRIEPAGQVKDVEFINDSKATNPDSTVVALKTLGRDKNIILILGGRDKGGSLDAMCDVIKSTVRSVILIGEASERFNKALLESGFDTIRHADTLDDAVKSSLEMSHPGDKVLLSPACASFDMFEDYEHRGKAFKQAVAKLIHENT